MSKFPLSLPIVLFLFSCSESDMKMGKSAYDTGNLEFSDLASQRSFRLDVYPSDAVDNLMPQSYQLDGISNYIGLDIELLPTVNYSGNLYGYDINPTSDIVVPGNGHYVEARVELEQENSIAGAVGYSSSSGDFILSAPSGAYDFLISPIYPVNLPLTVIEDLQLDADTQDNFDIGYGRPLFGTIMAGDVPLANAYVQIYDTLTNTPSSKHFLDENGQFRIRLPIDRESFRVEVSGITSDLPIPNLVENIQFPLDSEYLEWQVDVGTINETTVRGSLRHPNGEIYQERALIRFQSVELTENSGTLVIETNNDSNGTFRADLLPGRWSAFIIPPYGEDPSVAPTEIELMIESTNDLQLGEIALNESINIVGNVLDPQGLPANGVLFTCKETSFDNNVYATSTNADGQFSIQIPPYPCDATLTPISNTAAIQYYYFAAPSSEQLYEIRLETGTEISGTLLFDSDVIPFALVEIRDDENNLLGTTISDNTGRFNLRLTLLE